MTLERVIYDDKLRASQSWIAIPLFLLSMVSFAGPIEDLESKNRILEEQLRQVQIAIAELNKSYGELKAKVTEQSKIFGEIFGEISGPIFRVIERSAKWNATHEAFRALGPDKMYVIRDPNPNEAQRVPPFILSHNASRNMNQRYAVDYCQRIGGTLPTKEQLEALSRAMTRNGRFDQDALPDFGGRRFWSASVRPDYPDFAFFLYGGYGCVGSGHRDYEESVRCVLPAVE